MVAPPADQTYRERVRQVLQVLLLKLEGGEPQFGAVARQLPTSERTLQRRLKEEGTCFSEVLDELRRELALRYTEEGVELDEISIRLGFAHSTALHRAFKRWTRTTPGEYRRRQRS